MSLQFTPLDSVFEDDYKNVDKIIERNGLENLAENLEAVKRMLAVASTEKIFEIIHRLIFNSSFKTSSPPTRSAENSERRSPKCILCCCVSISCRIRQYIISAVGRFLVKYRIDDIF